MSVEILYLAHNRREFTEASLNTLQANTNWGLVDRCIAYDEESTDGTLELLQERLAVISEVVPTELRSGKWLGPVGVMKDYLAQSNCELFCKIDSDVILPPGWLDSCITVMEQNPELDLLGIEPPHSRTGRPGRYGQHQYDITMKEEITPGPLRYVACKSIGGVGIMRRSAFMDRPILIPHGVYFGFWQWQTQYGLKCGWIAPALRLFLLDRIPFDPWVSLSQRYIRNGWQRPWNNYRGDEALHLWGWWDERRYRKIHERQGLKVGE